MNKVKKRFPSLIAILFLIIAIFLTSDLVKKVQKFLSQALGQYADIVVDTNVDQGPILLFWQALAQGGEEKYPFDNIISQVAALKPKYIRIDHIYDFYNVVQKEGGQLRFNWSELDKIVNDILKTKALPFFSLSYMPPAISSGDITSAPNNWAEWQLVIQKTIEHFSGRNQRNLTNIYYEVWNEPDLFGRWSIGGGKNYQTLYQYAVLGANQAQNTNSFKIGGPSTTAPYQNWVNNFLDFTKNNNLRIDFYSWHRYGLTAEKFQDDITQIDSWLFKNAGHSLEKVITEWGSDSENSPYHDSRFDAAHTVSIVRQLLQRVDWAFSFEVKDGPEASGKKYWGRWGLLTHEKAGPISAKPRYFALNLLNKMTGNRLKLEGEGSWVTGFASKEETKIKVILTNLDPQGRHFEHVPLTFKNLENGDYAYSETYLLGEGKKLTETVETNELKKIIPLSANNIIVIELTKI